VIESSELIAGRWWRFSRYELNGWHIIPAMRAKLEEYDPWAEYRAADDAATRTHPAGKRALQPPYMTLLDMFAELPFQPGGESEASALKPAGRKTVLDWCSRHGLLGVLPHRARLVALAPVATAIDATQVRYARTTDRGWVADETRVQLDRVQRPRRPHVRRPDPPELVSPHVVIEAEDSSEARQEALVTSWSRFFPATPTAERETFQYPRPLSPEFWRTYGEPLYDFLDSARLLQRVLRLLAYARETEDPEDNPERIAQRELQRLNRIVATVSPALYFVEGNLRQRWSSPSLLASYAMMALLDLSGNRVRACAECGRLFVTDAYQTRYCSPAHSNRARKRAYKRRRTDDKAAR
jgi:hypothetical protein